MERIKCFLIEKTDLPLVWKGSIGTPQYKRLDTGEIVTGIPVGAIFHYQDICRESTTVHNGPDGKSLVVVLPPDDEAGRDWWFVDGPSENGNGWTRTGTLPEVTANPSILTKRYHGFLRNGYLESC